MFILGYKNELSKFSSLVFAEIKSALAILKMASLFLTEPASSKFNFCSSPGTGEMTSAEITLGSFCHKITPAFNWGNRS